MSYKIFLSFFLKIRVLCFYAKTVLLVLKSDRIVVGMVFVGWGWREEGEHAKKGVIAKK